MSQKTCIIGTDILLQYPEGCQKTSCASLAHYGCPRTDMSRHNNGYIMSPNCRIRSSENPHALHEKSLHPQKISVQCAFSRRCIVGTISFKAKVDSEPYQHIITYFISISEDNKHHCWLQPDGVTCHTSCETMDSPKVYLTIIPFLKVCSLPDYQTCHPLISFSGGPSKRTCTYRKLTHTLEELTADIKTHNTQITGAPQGTVSTNFTKRISQCCLYHACLSSYCTRAGPTLCTYLHSQAISRHVQVVATTIIREDNTTDQKHSC